MTLYNKRSPVCVREKERQREMACMGLCFGAWVCRCECRCVHVLYFHILVLCLYMFICLRIIYICLHHVYILLCYLCACVCGRLRATIPFHRLFARVPLLQLLSQSSSFEFWASCLMFHSLCSLLWVICPPTPLSAHNTVPTVLRLLSLHSPCSIFFVTFPPLTHRNFLYLPPSSYLSSS